MEHQTIKDKVKERLRHKPIKVIAALALLVMILTFTGVVKAEPRAIHEGINGPLEKAVRGTQVQVNPPPPPPRVWRGQIPAYYGRGSACTQANANLIAISMWDVGANDAQVFRMLNIISRESGCDSSAFNGNRRTGDDSWGFCQINSLAGFFRSGQILENYNRWSFAGDPRHNAQACAKLYSVCGFGPWNYGNYYCSKP